MAARFTRQAARRNDSKIAGMYDLEERLGAGHFAEVKLARHVFTGERVAVKVIDKLKLDDTAKHHLFQEVRCMKLVQHPNIVRLYEVIDTNTKLYLVQELGDGGDMYDYIMKHERGFDEYVARRYFRQILQAIHYCHKLYVVHRDLKPENVIFFKKFDVAKLTDFGFSNKFMPGKMLDTACGSLAYSAPEILLGDSYDAPAVDVWSLGVILYMMVVGKAPFYEVNESETLTMILDCKFHIPDYVSPACKRLISRMIVRDATKRAVLEEIMSDPWIVEDHGPMLVTTVPLANQVKLGVDQHNEIVQKMMLGDIADKETIKKCLEAGSYNHISATYYLLAEQVLRRLRWHKTPSPTPPIKRDDNGNKPSPNKPNGTTQQSEIPLESIPGQDPDCLTGVSVFDAMADEPLREEPGNEDEDDVKEEDTNLLSNRLRYHSTDSIHEQVKNGGESGVETVIASVSVNVSKKQMRSFQKQRVFGVKSTPVFLNQISEERESDVEDSPRASPRLRRLSRRTLGVVQPSLRHSSSSGGRSSSVSSSSEEDVDLDKRMRRLSTERGSRRSPKRRSDDEGDGDDGEDGTKCSRGVARKKKMSECSAQSSFEEETYFENEENVLQEKKAGPSIDMLGAVLKDKLIEVHFKIKECKESGQGESTDSKMSEGPATTFPRRLSREKSQERVESWEGNLHGRESLVRTVRELGGNGAGGAENGTVDGGVVSDGIVLTKDEGAGEGLIRIGILEDGIVKYGVSADVVPEEEDSVECDPEHEVIIEEGDLEQGNTEEFSLEDHGTTDELFVCSGEDQITDSTVEAGAISMCETSTSPRSRDATGYDVMEDGIMEVIQGDAYTEGDNRNIDDDDASSLMDFSLREPCSNGEVPKVIFRGSDIDEIQMTVKAKETGLELESIGVRTIYNSRKVSQVTSNCCQII